MWFAGVVISVSFFGTLTSSISFRLFMYVVDDIAANKVRNQSEWITAVHVRGSLMPVTVTVAAVVNEVLMGVLCTYRVYIKPRYHAPEICLAHGLGTLTINMKVDVVNLGIDPSWW